MGIIVRQSLKRTTVTYLGTILGFTSVLFIYPLAWETYGLAQFAIGMASMLTPFATLGITSLTIRFFPEFQNKNQHHHGFLGLLLLGLTGTFLLFLPMALILETPFLNMLKMLGMDSEVFASNRVLIFTLVAALILQAVLVNHTSNFKRIVVPIIFSSFLHKLILPGLILCIFYGLFDLTQFKIGFIGMYALGILGILWYLRSLGQLSIKIDWSFLNKDLLRRMAIYSGFGFFTSIGALMAFRIDSIMVTSFLGYEANGFYSSFVFMTFVMLVPYQSLSAIVSPLISEAWNNNATDQIKRVYRGSAETLIIAGLLIFLGTWLCLGDLLTLTDNLAKQAPYKMTFFFLGLGQLINLSVGINDPIIAFSKYFRFNLVAILILGLVTMYTNYILIPIYGLVGAGMSTGIAFLIFNLMKLLFIQWKFELQPFSIVHLKAIALGLASYAVSSALPIDFHPVLNILLKGGLFVICFVGSIVTLKVSQEVNDLLYNLLARIRRTS